MYSRNHALLAAVLGIPVAAAAPAQHSRILLWVYFVALGVGIDFDHFVIARLNRGDWTSLRRCLRDPSRIFADQASIFDHGDVWRDQRLLSHLLLGGALVAFLYPVSRYWAICTLASVYTHVLADLYSDGRTRDQYLAGAD
ncbi:hypothetical protein [Haloplanus aerogenes]|uniref:Metal-dependent hydrolase n=1 Tax=Haloplanus aerogenes TaxID=660522 RepID=A0A3M0D9L7_9EURY|nr:hypothetical protein [Haloplanus aerogenes]AZH26466.1 hypothetical protein DU502_14295 [Haloplanus aerogenes]RMB18065.1 hypothetical protein ATH50_1511 [Haloplanus aerogenes]